MTLNERFIISDQTFRQLIISGVLWLVLQVSWIRSEAREYYASVMEYQNTAYCDCDEKQPTTQPTTQEKE